MDETKSLFAPPGAKLAPPSGKDAAWLIAYRRIALCVIPAAIVLGTAAPRPFLLFASVGMSGAVLFWCALDARVHEKPFPHGIAMALAFTWPVGIAAYLVWTRGWGGLAWYMLAVTGLTVLLLAEACVGALL
jgi:hypothetical protein